MSYVGEVRSNWRALSAAAVGLAVGYTLNNYMTNIFLPHLLQEFHWSKSDFALLGVTILVAVITQPVAGRLTDAFGVRRVALLGVIASPLIYVAYSRMSGDFGYFAILYVLQILLVGGTTSVVVYSRLIAQTFSLARGLALGIAAAAPAIAGAAASPLLSGFIDQHGWRAGYLVVAAVSAVGGLLAILLIPRSADSRLAKVGGPAAAKTGVEGAGVNYAVLLRDPAFLLIIASFLLCNLTLTLQISQINLVVSEAGVDASTGALMLSIYALGVIAGRLICGAALDRFPAHIVAAICLALPAVGLFILASGSAVPAVTIAAAVALLGLALGAEGDVGAYLVMRYFRREIFSSVVGFVIAAYSVSGAVGAVLLSGVLKGGGGFGPFLVIGGLAALVGGLLLLWLPRTRKGDEMSVA